MLGLVSYVSLLVYVSATPSPAAADSLVFEYGSASRLEECLKGDLEVESG
jgi:hypothetical protein